MGKVFITPCRPWPTFSDHDLGGLVYPPACLLTYRKFHWDRIEISVEAFPALKTAKQFHGILPVHSVLCVCEGVCMHCWIVKCESSWSRCMHAWLLSALLNEKIIWFALQVVYKICYERTLEGTKLIETDELNFLLTYA